MGIFDRTQRGNMPSPLSSAGSGGGSGSVDSASNLGAGAGVFKSLVGTDLQFKSLIAGSGVVITQNANDLTLSASGSGSTELRTISTPEGTTKSLTLAGTPTTPSATTIEIEGAPGQFYGDDFTVSGNVLSWSGLGLDGILLAGDKLTIKYN